MLLTSRKVASKYGASSSVTLTPPTHGSVSTIGDTVMRDTARSCSATSATCANLAAVVGTARACVTLRCMRQTWDKLHNAAV